MSKPILANIPSGYNTNRLYSILPFDGSGDFTFNRASSATRINKDGLIETVSSNIPRLDYADGSCPSLLLEPQRKNDVLYSQEFDSYWVKSSCLTDDNYAISPSGELNACRLIDNNAGGAGSVSVYKGFVFNTNTEYTFSCFAKKDQVDFISLRTASFDGTGNGNSFFNIADGTLGTIRPDHTAKIEDYGNGWYRCSITFSVTSGDVSGLLSIYANEQDNVLTSNRNGTTSVFIYGAQLEEGSYPTSYIKTTGSAVTRLADNCYGAGDSNLFNDSEGVIYIETKLLSDVDSLNRYIVLSDNAGSPYTNYLILYFNPTGFLRIYKGGFSNIMFDVSPIDLSQNHKIALQYKENDNKLYIDGIEQSLYGTFVETSLNGLNDFSFTINNSASFTATSKTKDLRVYNEALTDKELATLTSL